MPYMINSVFDKGEPKDFALWIAHRIHNHTMTFDEGVEVGDTTVWSKSTMIVRDTFLRALADQFEKDDENFDRNHFLDIATQGTGDRETKY